MEGEESEPIPVSPQHIADVEMATAHTVSDSDDSDSSDSDNEAQQTVELQNLQSQLSTNPSNYDTHIRYIKLLRTMGELDKLRQARETMSALFPLSPEMWQEWAKDEASHSSGPVIPAVIENLYERGTSDYLSVSLWCDYLNFVREHDPSVRDYSPNGISKARHLFERAITAAGLHVTQGNKIWDAYREFEHSIFNAIDQTDIQAKEKQAQCIRRIYHRQLSVPLASLKSTLIAYKAWEVEQGNILDAESDDVDGISSQVALAYKKALEMYNARAHLEEEIARQDSVESEKFQHFMSYLKFEQSSGDPARVQILYERAITEFPVSSDLWLDYTRYVDKTLKVGSVVRDVYSRATRNCPWIEELWVQYLLSLERGHASEKDISDVYEKSLQCTFSTFEGYLDLFLTRIDGLRRRISLAKEGDALSFSLIKETFQRASEYLSPHMNHTDGFLHLYSYWARLELKLGKDLGAARGVWENLLKICSMFEAWQGYITMEIELGQINEARSLYKRCYSKSFSGTGSEDICQAWLRFEREFGTLDDFDRAVQKVSPRLEQLKLFRLQQESISLTATADQREHSFKKTAREKRKSGSNATDEQSPAKRQKNDPRDPKKLNQNSNSQEQNKTEINEGDETKDKVDQPENEKQIKDSSAAKNKVYTDQCTAFISNLPLKANDEDIHQFFSDVGGVSSIRILHDKFTGKSRGLAYVDFIDDDHLARAVAKNKHMLLEKRLSIARSNPKQKKESNASIAPGEHVGFRKQTRVDGGSASKEDVESSKEGGVSHSAGRRRGENIQLKGKNTFAVPRNVRALGWTANKPRTVEEGDEKPKSNDEFRKMFLKK
ncbi:hypothetical protein SLEP1_g40281 [Rubroshorea leprosula]|uniref:RRM domain-containing protein n=1 Tax=Rubroshorea leprosula TaxID=152421 RepID=A0AAV5L373_9ROSI|nr:hypothetical protein SLEP1_g40281 [Rubroshorea leprosula]